MKLNGIDVKLVKVIEFFSVIATLIWNWMYV